MFNQILDHRQLSQEDNQKLDLYDIVLNNQSKTVLNSNCVCKITNPSILQDKLTRISSLESLLKIQNQQPILTTSTNLKEQVIHIANNLTIAITTITTIIEMKPYNTIFIIPNKQSTTIHNTFLQYQHNKD